MEQLLGDGVRLGALTGQEQVILKKVRPPAKIQIPQGEEEEEEEDAAGT